MLSHFILYSLFLTVIAKEDRIDTSNSNSNVSLEYNVSASQALRNEENTARAKPEKSKSSKHSLLRNIMEDDLTLSPEITSVFIEELKDKSVIRKLRKHANTTIKKESQYVRKKFIYSGSFLTFCGILFGMYLMLILSIQVWILMSRIEIKNGTWSLSPAEKTTWWFDQVENLGDEPEVDETQRDSERLIKKRNISQSVLFSHAAHDTKKLKKRR